MNRLLILSFLLFFSFTVKGQSDTTIAAGPEYSRSKFSRQVWGDHYRDVWVTPINVPILDPSVPGGGLTPKELGGGKQTQTLQFEGKDGNEYVARSVNKNPDAAVPEVLLGTYAAKVVKDQVSSAHPYGALVVSKMADALGIFHADPKLYYVPKNPGFGEFSGDFNDVLVMLEIRPDEDAISLSHYDDVNGSEKLFEHLSKSSLRQVDQKFFLKSRLFDMLLGDWDRHSGQFKWGEIKAENDRRYYYPLPKDRDQVFTLFDGIIPSIASKSWAVRELEHFDHNYHDIIGLNYPARNLDRRLLNGLSKQDWIEVAQDIKATLTDDIIHQAVLDLPPEVYPLSGPELEAKLKSRRDQLPIIATEYYEVLAKKVNITGSDEPELFIIDRKENGDVDVTGYNLENNGQVPFFKRTFSVEETKEIRVYSMGGADSILVSGMADESIKIRLLPGTGRDYVKDISSVKGGFHQTKIYTHKNSRLVTENGSEARIVKVNSDTIFAFSDTIAKYSYFGPVLSLEYNVDDGLFIGGGISVKREGFRKEPWASEHKAVVNFATNSGSYNARYKGIFYSKIAKFWDIGLFAEAFGPKYFLNYFGTGNESEEVYNIGHYRLKMSSATFMPSVIHRVSKKFHYEIGPYVNWFRVEDIPGRFLSENQLPEAELVNQSFLFAGGFMETDLNTANDLINPSSGIRWISDLKYNSEIEGSDNFTKLESGFSVYYKPVKSIPFIFAHRIGGSTIIGDYKFFQSSFLGGTTNLRGFRRERFAGRSSAFLNNDIRWRVSKFNFYFVAGEWGLLGFGDAGRVWADNETSDVIHYSYGPGLWVNVLNLFLLSGSYGINETGEGLITVNSGFLF